MPKVPISTRVDEDVVKRLERVATVDRRTLANIIEICVEEYLPRLEAELASKKIPALNDAPSAVEPHKLGSSEIKYAVAGKSKIPPGKRAIAKAKEN